MNTIPGIGALRAMVGRELGASPWLTVDQRLIDAFAETTGDRQWIHTDPRRAAEGPFGGTVAHGLLTLSLIPQLFEGAVQITHTSGRINYGYDRVRFPRPVMAGSRLRDRVSLTSLEEIPAGARAHFRHTIEIEGQSTPACVADAIVQLVEESL